MAAMEDAGDGRVMERKEIRVRVLVV